MSKKRIEESVYRNAIVLLDEKGYISPVELLVMMDRLKSKEVEDWRFKRIPYLERVIAGNLGKVKSYITNVKEVRGRTKPETIYHSV